MIRASALDKLNEEVRERYGITPEQSRRELERQRSYARHNEAAARRRAREEKRKIWQGVVADKDAKIASKDAEIAGKNAKIAGKDAEIERLRAEIAEIEAKAGG